MVGDMSTPLLAAAVLAVLLSLAHSYLGERYILMRLFRRDDLPKLLGGTDFTTRTLRFGVASSELRAKAAARNRDTRDCSVYLRG